MKLPSLGAKTNNQSGATPIFKSAGHHATALNSPNPRQDELLDILGQGHGVGPNIYQNNIHQSININFIHNENAAFIQMKSKTKGHINAVFTPDTRKNTHNLKKMS